MEDEMKTIDKKHGDNFDSHLEQIINLDNKIPELEKKLLQSIEDKIPSIEKKIKENSEMFLSQIRTIETKLFSREEKCDST